MIASTRYILAIASVASIIALSPALAEGDAARGEELFKRCRACHSVVEGQNKVGPTLYGVSGRKAGTVPGYKYSPALAASGIEWSEETLDQWLSGPKTLVPGTRMIFPGFPAEQDRADVIAYLKQF